MFAQTIENHTHALARMHIYTHARTHTHTHTHTLTHTHTHTNRHIFAHTHTHTTHMHTQTRIHFVTLKHRFFAMADLINPGIFGDERKFHKQYVNPILIGREPGTAFAFDSRTTVCVVCFLFEIRFIFHTE